MKAGLAYGKTVAGWGACCLTKERVHSPQMVSGVIGSIFVT